MPLWILGKVPLEKLWPIRQGKSQVKQLYKHHDFNNKTSGIWLQLLNPMKQQEPKLLAGMHARVCVRAWVRENIHTCSDGFVSKCVIPWLVPEPGNVALM